MDQVQIAVLSDGDTRYKWLHRIMQWLRKSESINLHGTTFVSDEILNSLGDENSEGKATRIIE